VVTPYNNFVSKSVNGQSLIHLINLGLGEDIIGVELGIDTAQTFCTFLQQCPKIKTLYGVDNYPLTIATNSSVCDDSHVIWDEKTAEISKFFAHHHVKYSVHSEKAVFLEEDSSIAATRFEDNSVDFIFIDTYINYAQLTNELTAWYPKIKPSGLVSGHDWDYEETRRGVIDFRKKLHITSDLSTFDSVWVWRKD
jgi:hypothetical protein